MTNWSGTLTIKNISTVVNKIKMLLDGRQYSFVTVHEYDKFRPKLRQHQRLNKNGERCFFDESASPPRFAGFTFNDTYGAWGLVTHTNDEGYDKNFSNPYIVISHNEIKITYKASGMALIHWLIQLE